MRLDAGRRLLIMVLATTFAWPLPATADEPTPAPDAVDSASPPPVPAKSPTDDASSPAADEGAEADAGFSLLASDDVLVPYGAGGYRYKIVPFDGEPNFALVDFDDVAAGFSDGTMPFSDGACGLSGATSWQGDNDLLVRKVVDVPVGARDIFVWVAIDNDIQVFWNGHDVSNGMVASENCAVYDEYRFLVPYEAYTSGDNLLAARARNRHSAQYFDLEVTADLPLTPEEMEAIDHPNGGESRDPVHTFSGSFTHAEQDLAIPGRGPAIAFQRTYNSADSRVGPLGPGWTHSYAMRLADTGDGSGDLYLTGPSGRADRYALNPDGSYSPPDAIHTTLEQATDGSFTATHQDRSAWTFDSTGRLTAIIDRHGNTSELAYDAVSGNLTAVSDPAGRGSLTMAYTDGLLTSVSDWASPARTVTYAYDASGRLATVTDRSGEVTTYGYDGSTHHLTTVTDANGNVQVTNTYDAAGRVNRQQDARGLLSGAETTFSYTDNPDGTRTTLVSYPPAAFEPGFAPTQQHVHNAAGWLLSETLRPSSVETETTTFAYDAIGNRSALTDPRGNTTSFCYDVDVAGAAIAGSRGNLTRRIDPPSSTGADALVTLIAYDADNNVVQLVPPRGVSNGAAVTCATDLSAAVDADFATDMAYDASGAELRSVSQRATDPDAGLIASVTKFEYADAANPGVVTRVIPPRGNTGPSPDYGFATAYAYGASGSQAGMLVSVADPLGNTTSFAYDAVGRRSSVVDANGNATGADPAAHTTTYEYDAEDRPRFIRLPAPETGGDPLVTEFRYDPVGRRTVHIDAVGQVIRYAFDVRNDLVRVEHSPSAWTDPALTPADVIATTYAYDEAMGLTRITRAAGDADERATDYAHDGAGRLRSETQYPAWPATSGSLVSIFAYDPNGNLASRTDPLGQTTDLAYDALNRLTGVDYAAAGTADVAYTYDANGNRLAMSDGTGSTAYAYDELDRLLSVTSSGSVSVGYRYDRDGNRSRLLYPGGDDLDYAYDVAGRLTALTDWAARVTAYDYRPDGSLAGIEAVNGTTTAFTYDNALRLAEVLHTGVGGATLDELTYTLDAVGNVTAIADGSGGGEPVTERVSESSQRGQGNGLSREAYISADGRYVTFESEASDLVDGDTNAAADVFVHDRETDTTTRVSVASDGTQANGASEDPTISPDGRYVAFRSFATNLVAGDTNNKVDIFLHDRTTGSTSRVSLASDGSQASGSSNSAVVARDGTAVVFRSFASNLVAGDTNGEADIFVRDVAAGTTTRVSVASDGAQASGPSDGPTISDDGAIVAFDSTATNLVAGDTNGVADAFVHDRAGGSTTRVSVAADGTQANGASLEPTLDADGGTVAFVSAATNLVAGDTNAKDDVFVVTRSGGAIVRASVGDGGTQGNGHADEASLSADGGLVAFDSVASNLVAGDTNAKGDVFVRDLAAGSTTRWSVATDGAEGDGRSTSPTIAGEGHTVAFQSFATDLVPGDTNGAADVFVRAAGDGQSLTTYSYDRLYRLTAADGPSGQRTYAYDPVGNRLEMERDGTPTAYAYDAADRLTSVGGTAVTVDAAGNLTARGSDAYSYDAANRLVSASQNGVTQTATYDGDGTRVATTVSSTTTDYVHDVGAGLPLVIEDGVRRYVWGPAGLAYSVETATGGVEVVHADHLGSVRISTDATGTITATARYDEFGVPLDVTGSSDSPFGFAGEPMDPTGLVHLRARSYDPTLGRFLNRDPWPGVGPLPASLNRYSYAANNPLRYADPSGQCGFDIFIDGAFILLGIGAVFLGSEKERAENLGNLGMDVGGVLVPCGGGWAIRGAKTVFGRADLIIDAKQLQEKFKHAPAFGVSGNWNTENAQAFLRAIQDHVARTDPMTGSLHRQPGTWYFDPQTGVGAFFNEANEFVTGFKFTPGQVGNFPNIGGH